jgi:CBS domain-containing protein
MRSPLTGVVFALELTHRYDALLPLVIAATTAYAASVLLLEIVFVGEVMTTDVVELDHDLDVAAAYRMLADPAGDYTAWRQQLYPVVGPRGLVGVVTRGALFEAHGGTGGRSPVTDLAVVDPVVTHADQPLRHAAGLMARHDVTTLPVVDRDDERLVVGVVSLPQLLTGPARDQQEARGRERVLRVRLVSRADRTAADRAPESTRSGPLGQGVSPASATPAASTTGDRPT